MSMEEFQTCARQSIGEQVDAWDQAVVQPLIDVAKWWEGLSSFEQMFIEYPLKAGGTAAIALIAVTVGASAAAVVVAVLVAFAIGVGIGGGLRIVYDCADDFAK